MTRLVWLGGLAAIAAVAAIATLIAFRGDAAASDEGSCTRVDGYLSFCLNVPTSGMRRETTVPLVSLPSARADVRVEASVPAADAAALTADVDRSVERVEALFGHVFDPRPRVLLFGGPASFATGAHELFGYSAETSTHVANTYGGIFDRPTLTIALNWAASTPERMSAAIEHELGHLMIRELTGAGDVPIWLDEGIATLIEEEAANGEPWTADEVVVGDAVASSGLVSLPDLASLADFHAGYARLGRPVYAYVAGEVRAMEQRIGWRGVLELLHAIGTGARVDAVYQTASGESLAELERRVAATGAVIGVTPGDGSVLWTVATGTPNSEMSVSITGEHGYEVSFTITTDWLGLYRGSFGLTALPGTYTVRVAGTEASFSTRR